MRVLIALALSALSAAPLAAQSISGGIGGSQDLSAYALKTDMPTPATAVPPGVTDSGAIGTQTTVYALANHTHASKARKGRATTATDGTITVALSPAFSAVPICTVVAEATAGETNIVNAQLDGPPTASQLKARVNRSAAQAVALLGLTINVVQTSVATVVDYICIEP